MANEIQKMHEVQKSTDAKTKESPADALGPNPNDQQLRQAVEDGTMEAVTVTPNTTFADGTFHFFAGEEKSVPKAVAERNQQYFEGPGPKGAKAEKSEEKVAAHHIGEDDKKGKK